MYSHQDWTPRFVQKSGDRKPPRPAGEQKSNNRSAAAAAASDDAGDEIETHAIKQAGYEFKLALMRARQAKNWKQSDLAEKMNVKPGLVNDWEQGKVVPDGSTISKLNRTLGVVLPKPKK